MSRPIGRSPGYAPCALPGSGLLHFLAFRESSRGLLFALSVQYDIISVPPLGPPQGGADHQGPPASFADYTTKWMVSRGASECTCHVCALAPFQNSFGFTSKMKLLRGCLLGAAQPWGPPRVWETLANTARSREIRLVDGRLTLVGLQWARWVER